MKVSQGAFDKIYQESFEIATSSNLSFLQEKSEEEIKELFKKLHPYAKQARLIKHGSILKLLYMANITEFQIFDLEEVKRLFRLKEYTGDQKVSILMNYLSKTQLEGDN